MEVAHPCEHMAGERARTIIEMSSTSCLSALLCDWVVTGGAAEVVVGAVCLAFSGRLTLGAAGVLCFAAPLSSGRVPSAG